MPRCASLAESCATTATAAARYGLTMPATGAYRVGLVGYGLAGEGFHAPLIDATTELELAFVVTSSAERAERALDRYPGVEVLPDVEALWQRRDHQDLVGGAAPHRAPAPVTPAAPEAGPPGVVEKPLAATVADGRRLQEAA